LLLYQHPYTIEVIIALIVLIQVVAYDFGAYVCMLKVASYKEIAWIDPSIIIDTLINFLPIELTFHVGLIHCCLVSNILTSFHLFLKYFYKFAP